MFFWGVSVVELTAQLELSTLVDPLRLFSVFRCVLLTPVLKCIVEPPAPDILLPMPPPDARSYHSWKLMSNLERFVDHVTYLRLMSSLHMRRILSVQSCYQRLGVLKRIRAVC